jgi:C4-dicarboxylate-specific signal transduction histidine kinase
MESREVALMGRMTAGMTHELKNVLAIIKESAGLLHDILGLSKGDTVPKRDQLEKVASRIQAQVARGNEQLASLNWLAHSVSDRGAAVGIHELSSQIWKLMQRFARLKQVELVVEPSEPDVTIHTNVPRLLVVLVTCVEYYLNRESPNGRVVLRSGGTGDEASLGIAPGPPDRPRASEKTAAPGGRLPSELAGLEPLFGQLGARLTWADPAGDGGLHLTLPSKREEDR